MPLCGYPMSTDDMITRAAEIEGHPDNILLFFFFLGGITIGCLENAHVYY